MLKYDQLNSDFNLEIVRECRGIILDETDDYRPVCVPFFKFGNFGESYVADIEWRSARIQEKLDGSLIKLWNYNCEWHISSNGEIDARNANINSALLTGAKMTNLYALFTEAWEKAGVDIETLNPEYTYMFELTSPHNRVVVRYVDTSVWHIGTRNNNTLQECDMDIGIPKPKTFDLATLDECIESAKLLGYEHEGYVVVDRCFNRIKVKSPLYVALNHISQGVTSRGKIVEIIQRNEQDELLSYFPEFREAFDEISQKIECFAERLDTAFAQLIPTAFETRKDLAAVVKRTECPACLFSLIDGKSPCARQWLLSRPAHKILDLIELAGNNSFA